MQAQQTRKASFWQEPETPVVATPPTLVHGRTPRAEARQPMVRSLEYSHYPRKTGQEGRLQGLSRDESPSGLCAVVDRPEPRGSLLQVGVHDFDGGFRLETLALVAWCQARPDGRYAMGLSFLANSPRGPRAARTQRDAPQAARRSQETI